MMSSGTVVFLLTEVSSYQVAVNVQGALYCSLFPEMYLLLCVCVCVCVCVYVSFSLSDYSEVGDTK